MGEQHSRCLRLDSEPVTEAIQALRSLAITGLKSEERRARGDASRQPAPGLPASGMAVPVPVLSDSRTCPTLGQNTLPCTHASKPEGKPTVLWQKGQCRVKS